MWFFKPVEVAKIAMAIEKNGMAFYQAVAERVQQTEAKALFSHMAEEEAAHHKTFERLSSSLASYEMPELYDGEYEEYMRALVDSNVFAKDASAKTIAGQIKDPIEAIELALGFEKDSIILFDQFKRMVPREEQSAVDMLIAEENKHIKKLLGIKKMLTGTAEEFYASQKTGDAERT
ncbi:MAG: ferritin family protein [Peptococcaceae bacterium]|nr:ferritin family protein [Peptococcaceae bacterium]